MRVALYIRVSTEDQAREGYSIQAQKNKLEAYCVSQGWDVVGFYIDDGYSAKDLDRPEMKRMLKHIEQGLIDCVLVYRLDRLTRSVLDLYKLLEIFEQHNCKFKSATEVYDTTTAMGRMFITIVAAMAQWERENLIDDSELKKRGFTYAKDLIEKDFETLEREIGLKWQYRNGIHDGKTDFETDYIEFMFED